MNSKTALIGAAAVGAVMGAAAATWFFGNMTNRTIASATAAEISMRVSVLEKLRAGDSAKASDLLEVILDGDLVMLDSISKAQMNEMQRTAIARAAEYRAKYPYSSPEPSVRQAVARILANAPVEKAATK